MVQNQITDDRFGHLLRTRDRHLSTTGGKTLDFDDIATLILQRGGHIIESGLGVLAQHRLSRLEKNFGLSCGLVLIDVGDHLLDRVQAGVRLLRGLLRGLRLVAGVDGMLVGLIGLVRSEQDSLPAPARRYP